MGFLSLLWKTKHCSVCLEEITVLIAEYMKRSSILTRVKLLSVSAPFVSFFKEAGEEKKTPVVLEQL